ncbi:hypothetical protein Ndes2526B_g08936 [Nannochloris sp. 'desiccata']
MSFFRRTVMWLPVGFAFTDIVAGFHRCVGPSMMPALNPPGFSSEDLILAERLSFRLYKYHRGDVVLFRSPTHPNETLIKRIIGLEGDWISIPNSSKIERIPKGHCWVEGDNNTNNASEENFNLSDDSRTQYGPIPLALLKGRAIWICYPFSRWGAVESGLPKGRVLAMTSSSASSLSSKNADESWW